MSNEQPTSVWKYTVPVTDVFTLNIPVGSTVLSVAVQGRDVNLWAEVDTSKPTVARRFRVAGTGHAIPADESRRFIGTFLLQDGLLVFHLFEILEQPTV